MDTKKGFQSTPSTECVKATSKILQNGLKILQANNLFEEKIKKNNINSLLNSFIASLKKKIQCI